MSRNTKIALGILGGLIVLCICLGAGALIALGGLGSAITRTIKTNPTEIAQISSSVAQFDVPPGYKVTAMSILGIDMLVIAPSNSGQPIFMMIQYPANRSVDSDQFQVQIEQSIGRQYFGQGMTFRNTGHTTANFRNQSVDLLILESTTNTGKVILEQMGSFQGNNGAVFLSMMGPKDTWDQATVDTFLHSIK